LGFATSRSIHEGARRPIIASESSKGGERVAKGRSMQKEKKKPKKTKK